MILWKLDAIARLGYAAFALDMFGTGTALWNRAQSLAARRPITEDRSLLQVCVVLKFHAIYKPISRIWSRDSIV